MRTPLFSLRPRKALPLLALLLGACSSAPPVPRHEADLGLPRRVHIVQRTASQPSLDRMLVVQQIGQASRWSLFDPLGVPLARQQLQNGQWHSVGLLPPNAPARILFAELIFAWMPRDQLDSAYGPDAWRAQALPDGRRVRLFLGSGGSDCSPLWTVAWAAPPAPRSTFTITQADGTSWLVSPLRDQP
ncbi:hypothetical protein [Bordetella sp. FB-8]|uniref:hypothetical protein n=1 Tax=Bordetella sp. FB-8 TaxID=1159870 RepID=UPI0003703D91|nr:hypothetical protein [Bordetella sp. FB-8]